MTVNPLRLTVEGLAISRGDRPVLAGVGFALNPGDVMVLRGANGAGKTSLLRALAGLNEPSEGRVDLFPIAGGEALPGHNSVAYLSHDNCLKPAMTVGETLAFWKSLFRTSTDIVASAAAATNIGEFSGRAIATLSAGQKRRVALARLVISQRPLWLLDEPTASLDTAAAKLVEDMVEAHCAAGGIAVIATHEPITIKGAQSFRLEAA